MRRTKIAAFLLRCRLNVSKVVCVCWGVVGAMGRDAAGESNQHLWLKLQDWLRGFEVSLIMGI